MTNTNLENIVFITMNDSKSKAYIQLSPDYQETIPEDALRNLIKRKGIKFGIIEDTVTKILRSKFVGMEKQLLAIGKDPKIGARGYVKYLIDTEQKLKEDEFGRVDFYDTGIIKTVEENQRLAKIYPPEKGEEGIDVCGKIVEGRMGKNVDVSRVLGKGVKLDKKGEYIIAGREGCYKKTGDTISVAEQLVVPGSLSFSVGNIDTFVTIIIDKDIRYGFVCKTKSDLYVKGVIENATIDVDENIICKSGITKGQFPVKAGKEIRTKYIVNRENVMCNDLFVEGAIYSSTVFADNSIEAERISGGVTRAKNMITVKELGNEKHVLTKLELGLSSENIYQMAKYDMEIKLLTEEIKSEKKDLISQRMKLDKKFKEKAETIKEMGSGKMPLEKLEIEKNRKYGTLLEIKGEIEEKIEKRNDLSEAFEALKKLKEHPTSSVVVTGVVYPNVVIEVNTNIRYKVEKKMSNVCFKINDSNELLPFKNE